MIFSLFKSLSGSHYRKFYRKCQPLIKRINELEAAYQKESDTWLQAKTDEFRQRLKAGETLDDILPEAFAVVKNGARRLCGREIEYVGTKGVWNMVHYDVQLLGGMALHQHHIAEMQTGEGKTLVATLPLYLNALAGRGAQLVTVNEYLAQRDAEWMGHLYNFLGLSVGVIRNQQPPEEKRAAYNCDITYGTASEFGFDYLRDNGMAMTPQQQVQRDHFFVIVDEVDSVLVDEARTPLIITGPMANDNSAPFINLKPRIERVVREQTRLCNQLINEAKAELEQLASSDDKKGLTQDRAQGALEKMYQVKHGMPKNKVLLRLLEDGRFRKLFEAFDLEMHGDHMKQQRHALRESLFFTIDEKQRSSDLTENGRNLVNPDDPDAFILPDLPSRYVDIDSDSSLNPDEKAQRKADEQSRFEQKSDELHVTSQLLRAYSLYDRDVEYVVQQGKVHIVDENTGRVMVGRRWSEGLHQAIEAKEGVQIERETKTFATITLQNYFRLYEKLAGMTGTAETEANEFSDIYKLKVMVIPTNRPNIRVDEPDIIYKTRREKYQAVIEEIKKVNEHGQPCLVGTVSVDASELLSRMLRRERIPHEVLNAKNHAREAEIVALAGQKGAVTIATNMAGRGTDIKLGEGVPEAGGLYVIGTERHTSRRIDRQLRGRCSRQGDPGRTKFFLSLEDDLMRLYSHGTAGKLLESSFVEGEPLEHKWLSSMIERAQKTVEQQHYSMRKRLLQYDDVGSRQREVVYGLRSEAMHTDQPREIVFELIQEEITHRAEQFGLDAKGASEQAYERFVNWATQTFPIRLELEEIRNQDVEAVEKLALERVQEAYAIKEAAEDSEALVRLERYVIIGTIDRAYQDHLTSLDQLRQEVGLRGYGQKDPLVEFKNEAFKAFEEMMGQVRANICTGIFRNFTSAEAVQQIMQRLGRTLRTSGPADPDGDQREPQEKKGVSVAEAARARQLARAKQLMARRAEPVATPREGAQTQTMNTPNAPAPAEFDRNEVVVIAKGEEQRELKWKQAEQLVKEEGWQVVGRA
ncbi:MAG: preprotein translocase subunit SecA [Verrucomicrobiota bacterium JB022]|nr:preprotein translocase subunit SecA [Verrucomicrobiota bacterium JB022]